MKILLPLALVFAIVGLWNCHLNSADKEDNLQIIGDSTWTQFDSLQIVMLDDSGTVLDTLFAGPLENLGQLNRIPATKYPGGTASLQIKGFIDGQLVFDQARVFDEGGGHSVDTLKNLALAPSHLTAPETIDLYLGGAPDTVQVGIQPLYANTSLVWSGTDAKVFRLEYPFGSAANRAILFPESVGEALLSIRSDADASIASQILVRVHYALGSAINIKEDSLVLFQGGVGALLHAAITPATAEPGVVWSIADSSIVSIDNQGFVLPQAAGKTLVIARSGSKALSDSIRVIVRVDAPRIQVVVSADTVALGDSVGFKVTGTQDYGTFTFFGWDSTANGDWLEITGGPWENSPVAFPSLSRHFSQEGDMITRFIVRDGEGNETFIEAHVLVANAAPVFDSFSGDTSVSIRDSVVFKAKVHDADDGLSLALWDYDGDGKVDDSLALKTGTASLLAGYRYPDSGDFHATLQVQDHHGKSALHTFKVKVALNPPVADAGKDTSVLVGTLIRIKAGGTDPNGAIAKRELTVDAGPRITLSKQDTAFNAPNVPGTLVCIVRVTDEDGLWDEDTVLVHIYLDSNAALAGLTLSAGTLSPAFRSDVSNYIVDLVFSDSSLTVTPKVSGGAKIAINGVAVATDKPSNAVKPLVGANPDMLKIVVTAPDLSQKTYFISLNRAPNSESHLTQLTVVDLGHVLAFDPAKLEYADTVSRATATVTVTPLTLDVNATVTIAGKSVARGSASSALPLVVGSNTIPVIVTAQDGSSKITYTLKIERRAKLVMEHAIGGAPVPYDSLEVALGASAALRPPTVTGFHFRAWAFTAGTGTLADATLPISNVVLQSGDARLWAQLDTNTYSMTMTTVGKGTTTPSGTVTGIRHFIHTDLKAVPDVGYHFLGWSGPKTASFGDSLNASTWVSLTSDASVQARFAINRDTLALTALNGTITKTPDSNVVDYGTMVTLTAKPNTGYNFTGWSGDTTTTNATLDLKVVKNWKLKASFTPKVYTLTVQPTGLEAYGCSVSPTGAVGVNHAAPTSLVAQPACVFNFGIGVITYFFRGWTMVSGTATFGDSLGANTTVTLTNGDAVIIATYTN